MKIIYSLYTEPIIKGRWGESNRLHETIRMFSLSILLSLEHYDNIEIYTDEVGERFFKHLPVKVTLLENEGFGPYWVKSKIESISKQNEPFLHVDGDVFTLNRFNIRRDSDVIIERLEVQQFKKHYEKQIELLDPILHGVFRDWDTSLKYSLNCGVIGFQNLQLRDRFVENYKFLVSVLQSVEGKSILDILKEEWYEICIVIEQFNLLCTCKSNDYTIQSILPGITLQEQVKQSKLLKYTHLYGKSKYEDFYVESVKDKLKSLYLPYYLKIQEELDNFKVE